MPEVDRRVGDRAVKGGNKTSTEAKIPRGPVQNLGKGK